MKVRQLITLLADYPPDADVELSDSMTGFDEFQVYPNTDGIGEVGLVVHGQPTEINPFRRGALEQLFDEVSTRQPEAGEEIIMVEGKHKIVTPTPEGYTEGTLGYAAVTHTGRHLDDLVAWATAKLLEDWPDPEAIREGLREQPCFTQAMESIDQADNMAYETDGMEEVLLDVAMKRAEAAAHAARGQTIINLFDR